MCLPQIQKSHCGCTLEVGAKIIAWFSLITTIVFDINYIWGMVEGHGTKGQEAGAVVFVYTILSALVVALSIFSILLIIGVYKKRASFMIFWIVAEYIGIVLTVLLIIYFVIEEEYVAAAVTPIDIVIRLYCLLIVESYYRNLKSGS